MADAFPSTHRSAVFRTRSRDPGERARAFDAIVALYWKPVYKYLRLRWRLSPEDAEDATQGFFARALEKELFARYDPERAKFRTFLRTGLDGFAANERRDAARQKRGGGTVRVPLQFETAEGELRQVEIPQEFDPDAVFQQEWVRSVFATAVEALHEHCRAQEKTIAFTLFERYDLDDTPGARRRTYAELAAELNLPVTQVTNHLAWARREFRRLVLDTLREVCTTEAEFRDEARAVLGVDP
jgi:RNA polymerase sigma factor (sigma-70 family)